VRKVKTREESAVGILATVLACKQLVAAIADGTIKVEISANSPKKHLRYAPHFATGIGESDPYSIPYTVRNVADILGTTYVQKGQKQRQASRWVRVAFELLEGEELGYVDGSLYQAIRNKQVGYAVYGLRKELKAARIAHELMKSIVPTKRAFIATNRKKKTA
jgi:hypothetical protein